MSTSQPMSAFERVLDAARAGEGWAFTELYERFAVRVKAFAVSRRVADPEATANDVMLRVFQNVGGFEGTEQRFVSWMFTIARNRIIDEHRASSRRPQVVEGDVGEHQSALEVAGAEEEAFAGIGLDGTLDLLALLTEDQREVVALRLVADLSVEQVSDIVGKPVTAVKALQRRGLRRLEREISGRGVS